MPTAPARQTSARRHTTPAPDWYCTKGIDPHALTVKSVLTFPTVDYAGDLVEPTGGRWIDRPHVNVEHREVIGHGSVELCAVEHKGRELVLPVGTTYFRKGDRLAEQVFRLVADDIMTGVSMEFRPRGPLGGRYWKSFGHRSPLENRDACHFIEWDGIGWAHTVNPVQPDARTVRPEVEKAIRIAQTNRLGSEALHPLIRKALTPLLTTLPRRATVAGGFAPEVTKAMPADPLDDTPGLDAPTDETAPADQTPAAEPTDTPPTAQIAYDCVQQVTDLIESYRERLKRSEHLEGKKGLLAVLENIESELQDAAAHGDMVVDDVNGTAEPEPEPDDAEEPEGDETAESDADSGDEDDEDKPPFGKSLSRLERYSRPLEFDADGGLVTKSLYKPVRFTLADLKPVEQPAPTPADVDADAERKALARQIQRKARELKRIARARRDALSAR